MKTKTEHSRGKVPFMKSSIRILLVISFMAFFVSANGQRFNANWKMDYWIATIVMPGYTVEATVYSDIDKSKVRTKPNLWYSWHRANTINYTKGGYDGKLLHGTYKEFYLNKNLRAQGQYKNGLMHDQWYYWDESGELRAHYLWKNGQKQGQFSEFDEKGQISTKGRYRNNELQGKKLLYNNGVLINTQWYKKGKLIKEKPTPSIAGDTSATKKNMFDKDKKTHRKNKEVLPDTTNGMKVPKDITNMPNTNREYDKPKKTSDENLNLKKQPKINKVDTEDNMPPPTKPKDNDKGRLKKSKKVTLPTIRRDDSGQ